MEIGPNIERERVSGAAKCFGRERGREQSFSIVGNRKTIKMRLRWTDRTENILYCPSSSLSDLFALKKHS